MQRKPCRLILVVLPFLSLNTGCLVLNYKLDYVFVHIRLNEICRQTQLQTLDWIMS